MKAGKVFVMLRLMNFSTHSSDLGKFDNDYNRIKQFLKLNGLNGLEVINTQNGIPVLSLLQ